MNLKRLKEILNTLLDERIDVYGILDTIAFLLEDCDCTKEELIGLNFDEKDIDRAIEILEDKDYE